MSEVLVLIDHADGEVKKPTYELLTIARRLGEPAAVFIGSGDQAASVAEKVKKYGAAKVYVDFTKSKLDIDDVKAMIVDKSEMEYGPAPKNTMPFAKFMHQEGIIKNLPSSWKDYFHESAHGLDGN